MSNMKYFIMIDEDLYGYDSPHILKSDIIQNKPSHYRIFKKLPDSLRTIYTEIVLDQLDRDLDEI